MTTVTLQDVLAAAETLSLDDQAELNRLLVQNIRAERDRLGRLKAATLRVGDRVSFENRRGVQIHGTISAFKSKNVVVDSKYDRRGYVGYTVKWTVAPNLLRKVDVLPPEPAHRPASRREAWSIGTQEIGTVTFDENGITIDKPGVK